MKTAFYIQNTTIARNGEKSVNIVNWFKTKKEAIDFLEDVYKKNNSFIGLKLIEKANDIVSFLIVNQAIQTYWITETNVPDTFDFKSKKIYYINRTSFVTYDRIGKNCCNATNDCIYMSNKIEDTQKEFDRIVDEIKTNKMVWYDGEIPKYNIVNNTKNSISYTTHDSYYECFSLNECEN